jgi:spore coat protein U-like protein
MVETSRRVRNYLCGGALLAAASVMPAAAQAGTATAQMTVTATVLSFCTISTTSLPFGNYNQVVLNGTATLSIVCTLNSSYNVGLDVGLGTGATVASRKMTMGAFLLNYGLYSDTGHSTVWGPTIGTNTVTGTGTGVLATPQTLTVYGQIPPNQLVPAGNYTDTVTATITF